MEKEVANTTSTDWAARLCSSSERLNTNPQKKTIEKLHMHFRIKSLLEKYFNKEKQQITTMKKSI